MMTKLTASIVSLLVLFPLTASAEQQEFKSVSYEEAAKAENYLRFDMASTKMGLITTHFTGYAKTFTARGEFNEKQILPGAQIEFKVVDMDTNVNGRNEKMWNKCLDEKNHPVIRVIIKDPLVFNKESSPVNASIRLRGEEKPITILAKASASESTIVVDLSTELSLKEMGIPDPSILVASVKDKIEIKGHIAVKKN